MKYLILPELTDQYAVGRGIVVTQGEADAYLARRREVLAAAPGVKSMTDGAGDYAARSRAAPAYLPQCKGDASLQRRYGGRIAARTGGAVPVDAYRRFSEDRTAQGRFRILDPDYAAAFWRTWTDDARWHFPDKGSDAAARAFDLPTQPGQAPGAPVERPLRTSVPPARSSMSIQHVRLPMPGRLCLPTTELSR